MVHHVSENVRRLAGMFLAEQQKLARHAGVTRQSMHKIMAGTSRPGTDTAMRIAKAFGISVEDLYAEPQDCLAAALPHLYDAPINDLDPGTYDVVTGEKVTPLRRKS
jgi:DNA-binding XRE family transcriptional regulator